MYLLLGRVAATSGVRTQCHRIAKVHQSHLLAFTNRTPSLVVPRLGLSSSSSAANASKSSKKFSELGRLLQFWKPEKWRISAAVVLLFVSSGVTMAVPFALGKIIDTIYTIDQNK